MRRQYEMTLAFMLLFLTALHGAELKVRNFTVNPSTGPLGAVDVTGDWRGTVLLTPPADWTIESRTIKVENASAPFRVVKASENPENRYLFTVEAGGKTETQAVCVASAPYGKLVIDAKPDPIWKDGIPLAWKRSPRVWVKASPSSGSGVQARSAWPRIHRESP
jgi:hypothetical protein